MSQWEEEPSPTEAIREGVSGSDPSPIPRGSMTRNLLVGLTLFLGPGSLLLFGIFLVLGPFSWFRLSLSPYGVLGWDAFLSMIFFTQHSLMVRKGFRRRMPYADGLHGVVFALVSGVVLLAAVLLWQKSSWTVASLEGPWRWAPRLLFVAGVLGMFWTFWSLRSVDFLGIRALHDHERNRKPQSSRLVVRGPYCWVRHPAYFFSLLLIWGYPELTADRLLLVVLWTVWIVTATVWEEKDLTEEFGPPYRTYQKRVPMLLPFRPPVRPV